MLLRFAVLCFIAVLASPIHAADPIVVKFSHVVAPDTPKGRAAQRFKESVERRTKGAVIVEVYPNSKLYKDKDEIDALLAGNVHIIAPSLSKLAPLGVPEIEVFDLPYIFPGKDLLRVVTDGSIGKSILKKLEKTGIVGLEFWENGFRQISANKPLHKPEDANGLKFRIPSASKVLQAEMKAIGVTPQVMGFSEVYNALKAGTVDGLEVTASNFESQKLHEVQKHMTMTNHTVLLYAVIANKQFWDGLPPTVRTQLKLAIYEATLQANLYSEQENRDALQKIQAQGKTEIYTPTSAERELWRKVWTPVHAEVQAPASRQLLEAIYKEGSYIGYKF